jgi:hypothetical protein
MSCSVTEDLGPAVFTEVWGFALSPLPSATPGSCIAAAGIASEQPARSMMLIASSVFRALAGGRAGDHKRGLLQHTRLTRARCIRDSAA